MTAEIAAIVELGEQLDSQDCGRRLAALESLCGLERRREIDASFKIGPVLPSYIHVHTTASYGFTVPGVHSVSRMVWAAHEAGADSIMLVEHESVANFAEAERAVALVNREGSRRLQLILGVEFKAPIALHDAASQRFSRELAKVWGQGEAAWVVGVGAAPSGELARLAARFQAAKRIRARRQLAQLNRHLAPVPPLDLSQLLTPEGNITDRAVCDAIALARWPDAEPAELAKHRIAVRAMLNPGGPGYAPYPTGLPSYQEVIGQLARLGMTPTFTAQLRGRALEDNLPLLKSWGIDGLDTAGIEPDDPNADLAIKQFIRLAERHGLALVGGSDYRGAGTGWTERAAWMACPLIRETIGRLGLQLHPQLIPITLGTKSS